MNPPSIQFHDPKCKLCRPAFLAIRRCQRNAVKRGAKGNHVAIRLDPDLNAFGVFTGWHVSLVK